MIRPFVTACFAALLALPALAQSEDCPRGAAVDGVYVGFNDRLVRLERLSSGVTAELEFGQGTEPYLFEYRTHPLGLVLASWEIVDGQMQADSVESVDYPGAARPFPQPAPGLTWTGQEVASYTDGAVYRYQTTVRVEAQDVFPIGACQYVALPIFIDRIDQTDGSTLRDALVYLTELGVVLYVGYNEDGGEIIYDLPISIGARPPSSAASAGAAPTSPPSK